MQRRRALQVLGSLAAGPALGVFGTHDLADLGARVHTLLRDNFPPLRALTPAQHAIVVAAAEQIIPRTDTPGATEARVADFTDVMLADWYPAGDRERFLAGLAELDARARTAHGRDFAALDASQQTVLVAKLDDELTALRASNARDADAHWFGMLKFLTVWGFYTSQPGMSVELGEALMTGTYDGDAPYTPRAGASGG
jgi:hypothetical protein